MPRVAEPRDRQNPIKVFVSARERKALADRASQAGMTVSAFLRAAGQGAELRSVLDLKAVITLAEINRQQAELAALVRQRPQDMETKQVLRQIGIVQARLVQAAQRITT